MSRAAGHHREMGVSYRTYSMLLAIIGTWKEDLLNALKVFTLRQSAVCKAEESLLTTWCRTEDNRMVESTTVRLILVKAITCGRKV